MRRELYELLEAINRADSLARVYDSAMLFICSTLQCSRVAILLLDDSGVMRFVASRGLSESYRQAVEGHSPWQPEATDPQPVCVPDVDAAPFQEPVQASIRAEGIRALAFIPLTYEGRLLGKFMIYFDRPHDFPPDELIMAQGIATQLAGAIHRRRADEALRQGEERHRKVVEQVKDYAIFSTDTQGRPTTWNEGVRRILGFEKSEFINHDIVRRIFTPEDFQQKVPEREFDTAARVGTASDDRWMRRKDGTRFWAEGVTTAITDGEGKLIGFSKVFRDSTAARRTQEQLAELKDQLAADLKAMTHLQEFGASAVTPTAGLESLPDDLLSAAISIVRADRGNVQLVDEESGALKIVAHRGFEPEFLNFFQAVVDQAAACAAAMRAGQRIIIEDVTSSPLFRNTQALQVLLNAKVRAVQSTPLMSRQGKVLGMISTHFSRPHRPSENDLRFLDILSRQAADVLERWKAESALRQTKEQLARANLYLDEQVQGRTASLNEALRSLETLLYTIAHDLRAPNRAMQGYADLLASAHAAQLDDEGKFFVRRIGEAALKNEALIKDLLEYGRLSHTELNCGPVDPRKSLHAVLQALEIEILAKKAAVEVVEQWPLVVANDSALNHILTNLVSNALKYARPGVPSRVRVFPEILNGTSDAAHHPLVRVCVRDNGIGVPPDQRESIFEPFQRASNANNEGTGMGLAIVRKAAERMGGRACVESNLGEGSTFWVELRKATQP